MNKVFVVVIVAALLSLVGAANATLVGYEGFEYGVGLGLGAASAGVWNDYSGTWTVAPGLTYPGLVTNGGSAYTANTHVTNSVANYRALPAGVPALFNANGTIYISCLVKGAMLNGFFAGTGSSLAPALGPGYSYSYCRATLVAENYLSYNYALSDNLYTDTENAHLWVCRIVMQDGNDDVRVVVDPQISSGEPIWATASVATVTGRDITGTVERPWMDDYVYAMGLTHYNTSWGYTTWDNPQPSGTVDEFRFATTWADVVPYNPATMPPAAPSGLGATSVSANEIDLTWTDGSDNEEGFKVESGPSETGPWTQVGTTGPGIATFAHTGLDGDTTHYYRVRAFNGAGDSDYSNVANATTGLPTVPNVLSYQGKLTDAAGAPVADGSYTLVFKVYDALTAGALLWTSADTVVTTSGGLFTAIVEGVPPSAFPANAKTYLEITVNGETLSPRLRVTSSPYAIRAGA